MEKFIIEKNLDDECTYEINNFIKNNMGYDGDKLSIYEKYNFKRLEDLIRSDKFKNELIVLKEVILTVYIDEKYYQVSEVKCYYDNGFKFKDNLTGTEIEFMKPESVEIEDIEKTIKLDYPTIGEYVNEVKKNNLMKKYKHYMKFYNIKNEKKDYPFNQDIIKYSLFFDDKGYMCTNESTILDFNANETYNEIEMTEELNNMYISSVLPFEIDDVIKIQQLSNMCVEEIDSINKFKQGEFITLGEYIESIRNVNVMRKFKHCFNLNEEDGKQYEYCLFLGEKEYLCRNKWYKPSKKIHYNYIEVELTDEMSRREIENIILSTNDDNVGIYRLSDNITVDSVAEEILMKETPRKISEFNGKELFECFELSDVGIVEYKNSRILDIFNSLKCCGNEYGRCFKEVIIKLMIKNEVIRSSIECNALLFTRFALLHEEGHLDYIKKKYNGNVKLCLSEEETIYEDMGLRKKQKTPESSRDRIKIYKEHLNLYRTHPFEKYADEYAVRKLKELRLENR